MARLGNGTRRRFIRLRKVPRLRLGSLRCAVSPLAFLGKKLRQAYGSFVRGVSNRTAPDEEGALLPTQYSVQLPGHSSTMAVQERDLNILLFICLARAHLQLFPVNTEDAQRQPLPNNS
ncbi:hypothetical protein KP509_09G042700 [Ceratopteris richardii]|uniref:Uncharacterized protein n=1 Tax=Ceratopteris richardii TaxID=49495 RepID=A0A8T2TZU3_CERRI|nr:hypothetical protein KP509_09G042700 [Ceratopteris richardii]